MFRQIRFLSGSGLISSRIQSTEFAERRIRLEKALFKSFQGAERSYIAPDVPHAFRQCSNFLYLTGVRVPGCAYLLHKPAGGKLRKILFMERRSDYQKLWEGGLPPDSELERTAGFDELLSPGELPQILKKMVTGQASLLYQDDSWANTAIRLIRNDFYSYHSVNEYIEKLRLVKSPTELDSMRDMMSAAIAGTRGYASENAIVGLLEFEARRRGAEMLAYPPVVAAGNRANTIHYLDANRTIDMKDCILVDAGCDLNGYVSDITRCWPISGEWSPNQLKVYEYLRFVHVQLLDYANSLEKIRLSNLYRKMIELISIQMVEAGIIPHNATDTEKQSLAEELCPHHVSHYLGMDVHDCASVSRDIDLSPGVCFTIEPGIYIPHNSVFPREFHGMGFRIEDDIAIKEKGIEVLTDAVPRTASEIEYLMNPL